MAGITDYYSGLIGFFVSLTGLSPEMVQTLLIIGIATASIRYYSEFLKAYPTNTINNQLQEPPVRDRGPLKQGLKHNSDKNFNELLTKTLSLKDPRLDILIPKFNTALKKLTDEIRRYENINKYFGPLKDEEFDDINGVLIHHRTGDRYDKKTMTLLSLGVKYEPPTIQHIQQVSENSIEIEEQINKIKEAIRGGAVHDKMEAALLLDLQPSKAEYLFKKASLTLQLEELEKTKDQEPQETTFLNFMTDEEPEPEIQAEDPLTIEPETETEDKEPVIEPEPTEPSIEEVIKEIEEASDEIDPLLKLKSGPDPETPQTSQETEPMITDEEEDTLLGLIVEIRKASNLAKG